MENIQSFTEFKQKLTETKRSFLLIYKSGSEQNICAFNNLEKAILDEKELKVYTVDVTNVRDVHVEYGITTVPSLLLFEKGDLTGVIKGCHDSDYYKSLKDNSTLRLNTNKGTDKPAKRVTVYSTPTCSWCNTLKSWLNKNNIRYTDVDISADQRAADELVKRTGQQGVPQTDINGRIIVGFDQNKLKELLEIR